MKRLSLIQSVLILAGASALLASCSSTDDFALFGYSTKSQFSRNIRTVYVPIFKNKTFVRGLEFQLTEAVIKQVELRTPWKVVHDCRNADAEITGTIVNASKHVIVHNQLNEVRDAELTLGVEVIWRDLRNGQVLSSAGMPDLDPLVIAGPDPHLAAPCPICKPMLVQRSAAFVPELGESITTAKKKVVDDLADQIVSMMEVPW